MCNLVTVSISIYNIKTQELCTTSNRRHNKNEQNKKQSNQRTTQRQINTGNKNNCLYVVHGYNKLYKQYKLYAPSKAWLV